VLIVLGVLAVLGVGGCAACAALVGTSVNEAGKAIDEEQNKNSITNEQARAVSLGTTRAEIEQMFGPPATDQESSNEGLGDDSCIYYNIRDAGVLDQWQFCFGGSGQAGKLRSKNRL